MKRLSRGVGQPLKKNFCLLLAGGLYCIGLWGTGGLSAATEGVSTVQAPTNRQPLGVSSIPDRREFPVNPKVDPCEDFYAYACSESTRDFQLRPDRSKHTFAFDDSAERLLERKKNFLKDLEKNVRAGATLSPRSRTLGTVYGACMDEQASRQEQISLAVEASKKIDSLRERQDFLRFLTAERARGKPSFLMVGNTPNQAQPRRSDFIFLVDGMTLPERSYYERDEVRTSYLKVLEAFFKTLGFKDALQHAEGVLRFETDFALVNPLPAEWRKIWNEPSRVGRQEVLTLYPQFELEGFYPRIPEETLIRHVAPQTHQWLQKQLAQGDLETLKSAYLWQALHDQLDDGYREFFAAYYDFQVKHLGAPSARPARDERCARMVMSHFTKELDAELLPHVFPDFPEQDFVALAEKVRQAMISGIDANTWLSDQGRRAAREKIAKARLQLVKPRTEAEWYFNPEISVSLVEPLKNLQNLAHRLLDREFTELKIERNPDIWSMGPLTVNAYYSASENKFVMPIGILQYPFYDPKLPLTTNLGAVGAVIGHELGHGIDDQGSRYNAEGQLQPWMTEADIHEFQRRGQVLVRQFEGIGHDGQLTLGENIGDLTGVTFAYRAAFVGAKGPKGVQTGSGDHEGTAAEKRDFFLQYARLWCQVMLPKTREKLLKTDPHALGEARVNQQLKNQPEFAKAYSCNSKQKMVLSDQDRAVVW